MTNEKNNIAVEVQELEKRFGDFVAVDRVSFQVRRGEVFGFLGPNGAGKSTTIRMLCGILAPSGGRGSVAGLDVHSQAEQIKANIGYMSQRFSLYEDLTVEENIDFFSGIYCVPANRKQDRKQWVLRTAGLEDRRRQKTGLLSGGWKQRLALGCAIIHEPPIVFLDEPTSGVDPISRRQFWDLIYELSGQGVTVFVSTHYMDEAEYCDRLGLMYRGKLIAIGSPSELKTQQMSQQVLEVECDRPAEAAEAMEKFPGVLEAALFGRFVHVMVGSGEGVPPMRPAGVSPAERGEEERGQDVPATQGQDAHATSDVAERIRVGLQQAKFLVKRVEPIVPSLEDVFVWLIETHDRRAAAQEVRR